MENNKEKSIGKGMLIVAWILVLIILTYIFGNWEEKQYNPNQTPELNETGELILERNRYNHYVASGSINGYEVVFLLDTGATDVAIPEKLARKIGLEKGRRGKAVTANGIAEIFDTQINSLQMGNITLYDVPASINPGMTGKEVLLGMSALKDLEFTQRGSTLTIRQI